MQADFNVFSGLVTMNLPQLSQFVEGLGKMLADGIEPKRALQVAGGCMCARENKRFAHHLDQVLLSGEGLHTQEFSASLPPFLLTIIECGILTGRIPQALTGAAHYIKQILPLRHVLRRCINISLFAYLICFVLTWAFQHRPSGAVLIVLSAVFVLPRWFDRLAYGRDLIFAICPFVGTWCQQVALLEFFSCLEICYDSSMSVSDMFRSSIRAVGNRYLRTQLAAAQSAVERGHSFADALGQVPFIPGGMIAEVRTKELCGKLELSFPGFARELKKVISAKLELIKAQAIFVIIGYGLIVPLMIVLPVFVQADWLIWYLLVLMGYLGLVCLRMGIANYQAKARDINCWWETLRDSPDRG
jgi:type II secretory pathway component PulF